MSIFSSTIAVRDVCLNSNCLICGYDCREDSSKCSRDINGEDESECDFFYACGAHQSNGGEVGVKMF